MSIVTIALQILTAKALQDQTLAGSSVISEPVDPLAEDYQMSPNPIIAVFTGGDARGEVEGRDLLGANREVELSIQIYCPERVGISIDGFEAKISTRSGGGGDVVVGVIERQIERALLYSDTPAAVLWRKLVTKIKSAHSQPYLFEMSKGARLVAQEILYTIDAGGDPSYGVPIDEVGFWADIVEFFAGDPVYAPIAAWIRFEIEGPEGGDAGRSRQADIGTTETAARFLSLRPLVDTPNAAIEFAVVDTAPDGETIVVDAAVAADALPPDTGE